MTEPDANLKAFRLDCQHCKKPRASMGEGLPHRQKQYQYVTYLWCVRCDKP